MDYFGYTTGQRPNRPPPSPSGVGQAKNPGYLPALATREDYVDLLEGHAAPSADGSAYFEPGRTLLKAYMLETARNGRTVRDLPEAFPEGVSLEEVDDSLFRVHDAKAHEGHIVGLLENIDERHPIFYTTMRSASSDRWVKNNVDKSPWLDRVWLSSHILSEIWDQVRTAHNPERYVRLGFEHEAKYEIPEGLFIEHDEDLDEMEDETGSTIFERRRSKVNLTERIGELNKTLPDLRKLYNPLHSLIQLQMPAKGRGGHLFNYDGKVTNRGASFVEHRAIASAVVKLYKLVTEEAEQKLWFKASPVGNSGFRFDGAPVFIQFEEQLSQETFDRLVDYGFQRQTSILRIDGYIHRHGPTKIHMSAIDHHLWQPFLMEVTNHHIILLLPDGTCGNTIHRLVTNIQRYITPKIEVWLGSEPYERAVHIARKGGQE